MNNKAFSPYFELNPDASDLPTNQYTLFRLLQAVLAYTPILLGFNTLGFVIIYILGWIGLLDKNDPRILIVAVVSLVASILHIPVFAFLRDRHLNAASILILLINSLGAASQVFLWQGIVWFPLSLAIIPVLVFVAQKGLQQRYRWLSFFYGIVLTISILYLEHFLPFDRMHVDSFTQMAALSTYLTITAAMFVLIFIHSSVNFHTISGRLVTTFTFVAFLSAMATLIIAALASLFYDRQGAFQELSAMTAMKTSQVVVTLSNLQQDANLTLTDQLNDQHIHLILADQSGSLSNQENSELVRAYLVKLKSQNSKYEELILLDATGKALISTNPANESRDFSSFNFFQNALMGVNSALEYNFPGGFEQTSILLVRPITINGSLGGALAARVSFDPIQQIMVAKTGIGETAETYLVSNVNGKIIPATITRQNTAEVNSLAAQKTIIQRINSGTEIYNNYAGISVYGSYVRIPALKAAVITEVEQQEITRKTLKIFEINVVFGLFTALLAFSIVLIISRSISMPLMNLAEKATLLASGELSTRMTAVGQEDEIGKLASSFNAMASEMQSLVKTLEQKVEDRTLDLQKQASYLRLAAEVARDSANTNNLDELLNRSAQLILDRFGFYHTGIFLVDERNEYAILQASPTEAGREMLARHHKLRVGQEGIVGDVSATGEPRIALDTGLDVNYFNNPLLPMTRSEIALPLKVNDQLLGVLDVQSEQPEAFTQDDISTLQIMSDQLALAIQRVRLSQEQEYTFRQLENTSQNFTLSSWRKFSLERGFKPGYRFDGVNLTALDVYPEGSQEILREGKSIVVPSNNETKITTLAVPLKLRNQILGVLSIGFGESTINPETINLAEEVASRLAVALENARLYSETQKQAEQTRAVSEISNIITSSVNIENILRSAVQELGHLNPETEVTIRLHDGREQE